VFEEILALHPWEQQGYTSSLSQIKGIPPCENVCADVFREAVPLILLQKTPDLVPHGSVSTRSEESLQGGTQTLSPNDHALYRGLVTSGLMQVVGSAASPTNPPADRLPGANSPLAWPESADRGVERLGGSDKTSQLLPSARLDTRRTSRVLKAPKHKRIQQACTQCRSAKRRVSPRRLRSFRMRSLMIQCSGPLEGGVCARCTRTGEACRYTPVSPSPMDSQSLGGGR